MTQNGSKPRCQAKTKAGKPCRSAPIKGTSFCLSHADEETRAKMGFGGALNGAKGGEAKRTPKLTELLRQRVEERAEEILDQLFAGLAAQRAVVVGTGPKARLEIVEDRDQVLKTIREIYDRFEGRPRQTTELTGDGGGPIQTQELIPSDANWHKQVADAIAEAERAAADAVSGSASD